ncbi:MAG TPA: SagB/ThcOx family dehydrogenase [Methanothrix sp.]|uniref:SagB/ThcOx family dehydrogenase n=1 Tax=Methanothrix sp. TaxID=90426 RepID=UPI002C83C26D|nr:SagB/ThcOx family dehydrogenase [Methanothrix sp.]MDI9416255.1 SagB/ThcOx family dehydrogenase [Euryarchaeota archaeon]HON36980.1 SagB/ThcOx family dehydrogenase [Methanothrix sp.]HRU75856.1 SagB/ThcOx family dehydrogenase [Methanothrix sp.]
MSGQLDRIIAYHRETKHHPNRMARGPGRMDWANQPHPYRSYEGAERIALDRLGFEGISGQPRPLSLNRENLSRFFFESLALSARKAVAGSEWSLRVNPSSGNLHPTECYLLAGGGERLDLSSGVYHYQPKDHSLELLAGLDDEGWQPIHLPPGALLLILTSIHWRESWKYGARAFRYCMLDLGHALAAAGESARCLGWEMALLDDMGTEDLSRILWNGPEGLDADHRSGAERPDLMLALFSDGRAHRVVEGLASIAELRSRSLPLRPNILSPSIIPWQEIDMVSRAARKPATSDIYHRSHPMAEKMLQDEPGEGSDPSREADSPSHYCHLLRHRRSAQAMDARAMMPLESFHSILKATLPERANPALPWRPQVNLVLFVHRVEGMERGLYILLRDSRSKQELKEAMDPDFLWERPSRTPAGLQLHQLAAGDGRLAARESSCRQDIAADGCFAAAMISRFEEPMAEYGPWFYSRLYWECGLIGQALYLSSEAEGFRGCGIGCFFDDMVHSMLGLSGLGHQDLYHFTVGRALIDPRLIDLPSYG